MIQDINELTLLIDAIVRKNLAKGILRVSQITGSGGDTNLTSVGDINILPGPGKKAYYKGVEIGEGTGIGGSGTSGQVAKFTTGGLTLADSLISDNGSNASVATDFIFHQAAKAYFYSNSDIQAGYIIGKNVDDPEDPADYRGIQIVPTGKGTSPGNIFIGNYGARPSGDGLKITEQRIDLFAITGAYVNLGVNSTSVLSVSASEILAAVPIKVVDMATSIANNTGNMKFTVASGKKFEFVVS